MRIASRIVSLKPSPMGHLWWLESWALWWSTSCRMWKKQWRSWFDHMYCTEFSRSCWSMQIHLFHVGPGRLSLTAGPCTVENGFSENAWMSSDWSQAYCFSKVGPGGWLQYDLARWYIYIYSCIHPICISPAIFTTTGPCFCPGDWSFIPVVRLQEHQSIAIQHLKFHRCELNPGLSFIPWFKICDILYIFSIQVIIPNGVWTQFYKVRFQF